MPNGGAINPRVCVAYARSRGRTPFFSPEECAAVIQWAEGKQFATVRAGSDGAIANTRRHRQLKITHPVSDEEILWFSNKLEHLIFALNERIWKFDLTHISETFIVKYESGDRVDRHMDLGIDRADRKLVLLVQLSAADAYVGGAVDYGLPPAIRASRDQGAVLALTSWTPHRVAPVKSGIRYSAACLAVGPSFR